MDTQAYRVAVLLTLNDELSKQLARVSQDATALDSKFTTINKTIQSITKSANSATTALEKMNKALNGNLAAQSQMASEYAQAMQRAAESAAATGRSLAGIAGNGAGGLIALAASNSISTGRTAIPSSSGGYLPPSLPPVSTGMLPGPAGLPAIVSTGRSFFNGGHGGGTIPPMGGDADFPDAGGGRNPRGRYKDHGMENLAIAYGGFEFMKSAVEAGAEYQTVTEKFRQFGLGDAALAEAEKFARSNQIMGSSTTDMLRYFTEAQGVFRESGKNTLDEQLAGAKMAAPMMAKIQFAMRGLSEKARASMTEAKQMDMLRFVEQGGGLQSATRFNELLNAAFKAIESSGGNVDFTQYRQFMAKARTSAYGMSDMAIFAEMEPIIGEMKGSSAGDAYMTSFNRAHGILTPTHQAAKEWLKLGLWDPEKVSFNSQGRLNITGDPLKDKSTFDRSQFEFYLNDVLPMYKKLHYTEEEIRRTNAILFGRTGGGMYNLFDKQMNTILSGIPGYQISRALNPAYNAVGNTYAGKTVDFDAKWHNFELALAQDGGLLDTFTSGLRKLTTFLDEATKFSNQHPNFTSAGTGLLELATGVAVLKGGAWALKTAVEALFSPISLLTGAKGIPLLSSMLGKLMPGMIEGTSAGTLAAGAAGGASAAGLSLARLGALGMRRFGWLGLVVPSDTQSGTREMSDLGNLQRDNWSKNHPGEPYPGTWRDGAQGLSYPPIPQPSQPVQINTTVNMDGKKVGEFSAKYLIRNATRAPSSTSAADPTMSLIYPGIPSSTFTN